MSLGWRQAFNHAGVKRPVRHTAYGGARAVRLVVNYVKIRRAAASFHSYVAGADWPGPLLDLALDELAKIFRRHAVVRDDVDPQFKQALTRPDRFDDRGIELPHDRIRGAFGQEDCIPGGDIEVLHALFARG